ncbi:peptidoglycan DD-metalloendopeptidase family protein [Rhizobiales bacterium RZME27]|uniref:Peptidoglycan DD-metalloendopeptidase family protein n=1 Tax=Endobacterium cereale TaxID=2663029 RepID=A0A6A8A2M3_9HYPH|nr:M23 family metallopeptidase [Endobacterium cereale]MEB2843397.1 M23 family metallopeptidase [Endobacterium cereale]MQY45362.1 peptidoglycan DD-metalloendopeptidase family protein [Endobacterium cereale]
MADAGENRVFGKRATQHVLVLASGDRVRHMVIRPWMTGVVAGTVALFALGYLGATAYLVLRDDLIGATMARQARIQHDYEDRISSLRAQLDRVTSRQLLDQQLVEQKVEKLLRQQTALFSRNGKLGSLLERAEDAGISAAPASEAKESAAEAIDRQAGLTTSSIKPARTALAYAPGGENMADRADRIFSKVTLSLKGIESEQLKTIEGLTSDAATKADSMAQIMRRTGVEISDKRGEAQTLEAPALRTDESKNGDVKGGVGGPFVEPMKFDRFNASLDELDTALSRLEIVRETAQALPYGNPAPGQGITSRFGNRPDPFLGRLAFHGGIDFQAETGLAVKATGAGKVITAGWASGYGNLVEIDHGQGITTRYGHMSRILVRQGQVISVGDTIGRAGATGRATGPHVHYEVRRNGEAVNPIHFLNAGLKLTTYMN